MKTYTTCTSTWVHIPTGKFCRIYGTKATDSNVTTFKISGHNPLPCFKFEGTYKVLVQWLEANNWARIFNANDYVPDTVHTFHK